MFMSLNSIIDKVHINKFAAVMGTGGALALLNSGLILYNVEDIDLVLGTLTAIKSLCGLTLVGFVTPATSYKQNRRYDSLMRKLDSNGYNKEFCEKYMDHPCGRSIVKTALKRTDHFGEYQDLKNNNPLNIKSFL